MYSKQQCRTHCTNLHKNEEWNCVLQRTTYVQECCKWSKEFFLFTDWHVGIEKEYKNCGKKPIHRVLKSSRILTDTSCVCVYVCVCHGTWSAVIQKAQKSWTCIGYVSHEGWSAVSQKAQELLTDISCVCLLQWHNKLKNSEQVLVMCVPWKLICIALKSSPNITIILQASLETNACRSNICLARPWQISQFAV